MKEPPQLKNGSGIPVIGIMPIVMPIFIKMCTMNSVLIPMARNIPNLSLARVAILIPFARSMEKTRITKKPPINPVSSAKTEKIKSFGAMDEGRYPNLAWVPLLCPLPKSPPVPIDIKDCLKFQLSPIPLGSIILGATNVKIRLR